MQEIIGFKSIFSTFKSSLIYWILIGVESKNNKLIRAYGGYLGSQRR
jgi:hypothetical protein